MDQHTHRRSAVDRDAQSRRLGAHRGRRPRLPRLPEHLPLRAGLTITVTCALALSLTQLGAGQTDAPNAYPEVPTAAGGGDPLEGIHEAEECSRANDRPD